MTILRSIEMWVSCPRDGNCSQSRDIEYCRKCEHHVGEVRNKVQCKCEFEIKSYLEDECFIGC